MARTAVPSYRLHKPTNQAVVTVRAADGRRQDVYLGEYGSPQSRENYARVVAELATPAGPRSPASLRDGLTVAEVCLKFLDHAEVYYRRPDGTQTTEVTEFKRTIKVLRTSYGSLPAA